MFWRRFLGMQINTNAHRCSGCAIRLLTDFYNHLFVLLPKDWSTVSSLVSWGGVRLSPLGTSATNWPIVPAPDDRWWVWSSRWNENWRGKPKYSKKKPVSAPLCPPQIPRDLTRARTRAAAVGSRRLTAWDMARSWLTVILLSSLKVLDNCT
jgi:hypothetical protein